jgi:hypothetical protein
MRTYYTLNETPVNKFVVCYMGSKIQYFSFDSPNDFFNFYRSVKEKRHFYEVIRNNIRKLIIDIDVFITVDDVFKLAKKLANYLCTDVAVFDSSLESKTSYHLIALSKYFSIEQCKAIVNIIDENSVCDKNIYKSTQLIRIEGSTKYNQKRYKYLYGKNSMSKYPERYLLYCKNFQLPAQYINKEVIIPCPVKIPEEYKIGKRKNDYLYHLKRIKSGYCNICERIHDNENAYIYWKNNQWNFGCFRYIQK